MIISIKHCHNDKSKDKYTCRCGSVENVFNININGTWVWLCEKHFKELINETEETVETVKR